jgi:hypothetical protein
VARKADVEDEANDLPLLRLRGAKDESDPHLVFESLVDPVVHGKVAVHPVLSLGGPDGRLDDVTDVVEVSFSQKGR